MGRFDRASGRLAKEEAEQLGGAAVGAARAAVEQVVLDGRHEGADGRGGGIHRVETTARRALGHYWLERERCSMVPLLRMNSATREETASARAISAGLPWT